MPQTLSNRLKPETCVNSGLNKSNSVVKECDGIHVEK